RKDKRNVYVAMYANDVNSQSFITIYVFIPNEDLCLPNSGGCSTARVIVWDKNGKPFEGKKDNYVKMTRRGQWTPITLDLKEAGKGYIEPYQAIGVHFYLVTSYDGAFYIDNVTLTQP